MAFSNTVSATNYNTGRILDSSFRRCKLTAQQITSEYIEIATNNLYLFLSDLANQGVPLWCIEKQIYPLYEGVGDITMANGTVDILNSNLRTLQRVEGTNTDTSTTRTVAFGTDIFVSTVGVLWGAASVPIALERSEDNIVWETVQSETPDASDGEWTWFDLTSSVAMPYFRVRATSGTLTFDDIYLANTPTEIPLARLNMDDYTNLPNKTFQNDRPLQYWFDRQINQPIMHLWPVPNAAASVFQIVLWRHRYIMDVGTLTQNLEIPQRWYEAIVAGLAAKLALEIVEVDAGMIPLLDKKAAEALFKSWAEERDASPMRIAPNLSMYNA